MSERYVLYLLITTLPSVIHKKLVHTARSLKVRTPTLFDICMAYLRLVRTNLPTRMGSGGEGQSSIDVHRHTENATSGTARELTYSRGRVLYGLSRGLCGGRLKQSPSGIYNP